MDKVLHLRQRHRQQDSRRPSAGQHRARGARPRGGVALQRVHALQPVPPGDRRRARGRRARSPARRSRRADSTATAPLASAAARRRAAAAAPTRCRAATRRAARRQATPAAVAGRSAAPRRRHRRRRRPCPHANGAGGFSLARQLGLGVSRIVIDPGHGGHDPGAVGQGPDRSGADARRRAAAREAAAEGARHRGRADAAHRRLHPARGAHGDRQPRRAPTCSCRFTPTPAATRGAKGVETYFLSFASSPEAEAVAARENSASEREMHKLPDIIKAIALNNKLDESRDLAGDGAGVAGRRGCAGPTRTCATSA